MLVGYGDFMNPTTCPIGLKYDYSPMTANTDPYSAEMWANGDRGTKFTLDIGVDGTKVDWLNGSSEILCSHAEWPAIDIDGDYTLQFTVKRDFNAYSGYLFMGLVDGSATVTYGIRQYYQWSNSNVRTVFLGGPGHTVDITVSIPEATEFTTIWKKVSNVVSCYVNEALVGSTAYDSGNHAITTDHRPWVRLFGGKDGGLVDHLTIRDIYVVSLSQSTDCLGESEPGSGYDHTYTLETSRKNRVFFTYAENKAGFENSPESYAESNARFEGRGEMTVPEPTRVFQTNRGRFGSGEHGTEAELMGIAAPWSYRCDRPFEIGYFLSYLLGHSDRVINNSTPYIHELKCLGVDSLELPTFGFQLGDGVSNIVYSGAIVNECTIKFPFGETNGRIDATFSGFANSHYINVVDFARLPEGTISIADESISTDPILNVKGCRVWLADSLETSFGITSVDTAGEDLDINLVELTALVNSITLTISNGIRLEDRLKATARGLLNDWVRGKREIQCELNMRRDSVIVNWGQIADAETPKALEVEWLGPNIYGTEERCAFNFFIPKFQTLSAQQDMGTPVSENILTEIFMDSTGNPLLAYFKNEKSVGFNDARLITDVFKFGSGSFVFADGTYTYAIET